MIEQCKHIFDLQNSLFCLLCGVYYGDRKEEAEMTETDWIKIVQDFHVKIDQGFKDVDKKFDRIYDALSTSKRDLSSEISEVTSCFHGHKKDCILEFTAIKDRQGQQSQEMLSIRERHVREDKKIDKHWDVKKIFIAGMLSGIVGWIMYKLTTMDAMLSKIAG